MNTAALARTYDEIDEAVESDYRQPQTISKIRAPAALEDKNELLSESEIASFKVRTLEPKPDFPDDFPRSFQLLQQWEGIVKEVTDNSFVAVISDKTTPSNSDEEVELDLREVPPGDLRLLRSGSLFYWSVGYEDGLGVPRQRVSRIRFQRLPGLTSRDIARAKETAEEYAALFK